MRKRCNLIFILVLGLILLFSLVACNQKPVDPNGLPNNVGGNNGEESPENASVRIKFTFPIEMSSIFNSIYVDKFELSEYVHYTLVYYDKDGEIIREVPSGGVTVDMVDEEDRQYLSVAGHHDIHVKAELDDNTTVSGVFQLHLKDRSGAISLAKYTFNLKDMNNGGIAYPYFGALNSAQSKVSVDLEKGVTIDSWDEFLSAFPFVLGGKALERAMSTSQSYSATDGFPLTVDADQTFNLYFTDDVVKVHYDLNVPSGAVLRDNASDPQLLFVDGGKYGNVSVQRRLGRVPQPEDGEINVYHGYTFAGWFNKATDTLWRFSGNVGSEDLELYARWVLTEYSFTVYTMGGVFVENLEDSKDDNNRPITPNTKDYIVIESSSRFSLSTGELNRITFTGFHFDQPYDNYVAEVTVNKEGDKVMLKFSEIYRPTDSRKILTKGGDSLVVDDLYSDYQCTVPVDRSHNKVNDDQPVTYVKWKFAEPASGSSYDEIYLNRISNYYTNVVFKDGYTILADGSIRLDQIKDWTVNELIVPAEIKVNGEVRKITEIGERALANAKAITKLDLSKASNLTTIGTQAFAHATYLAEIVMPENNSIKNIGDNAFWDTAFEDRFTEINKGAEFIVIGGMIYKYVGSSDKTVIDLSHPESYYSKTTHPDMTSEQIEKFNRELMGITSIEDGAFARCPMLQSLTLPATVTTIRNNALAGLERFTTLIISEAPAGSAAADEIGGGEQTPDYTDAKRSLLLDIGETAFNGTPFLSESGNLYDSTLGAIIIGNVYYRYLNANSTAADIPDLHNEYVITHIAAEAFLGCAALERLDFGNVSLIQKIEKDALRDTKIIRTESEYNDYFTVYNGILTDYYGPTVDANANNLIVPERVNTISSYAFGQYARYFETLQIGSNVKRIENYAFNGANMLKGIILTDIEVKTDSNTLVGAPSIGEYAFANSKGEMKDDLQLFFSAKVIDLFATLENNGSTPTDEITRDWFNLYKMRKDHFVKEDISSVEINREIISDVLLKTSEEGGYDTAFKDTYGTAPVNNALIIRSNTGVVRYADLSESGNKIRLLEIKKEKGEGDDYDYSSLWKEGPTRYVLTYTYGGSGASCPTDPDDPRLFIVTIHNAIKGNPTFYEVTKPYEGNSFKQDGVDKNANGLLNRDENNINDTRYFWFEGLNGQIAGADIPTYYTSYAGFNVVFKYIDINGEVKSIAPTRIDNLSAKAQGNEITAYIYVDFYGVGTFKFEYTYNVKVSRYEAIEQDKPINIPVNARATDYLRDNPLSLVGEDGSRLPVSITSNNFSFPQFDTSELGMHFVEIAYTRSNETVYPDGLRFNVCYTVILEADQSMFRYERFNDSYNTARIVECFAPKSATTLVLPSKCTIGVGENAKEYSVSQIGFMQGEAAGIFEGYKSLSTVYLPETIQCIGVNTFKGCSNLQNIYTAIQAHSQAVEIEINDANFEVLQGKEYKEFIFNEAGEPVEWTIQPVKLKTLENINMRAGNELIIASDYVKDAANLIMYRIVEIQKDITLPVKRDEIDLYLPDTIFKEVNILDNDKLTIPPHYYSSASNFIIKTANYVPEALEHIGTGAFMGCVDLESIDLTKSLNLTFIGSLAFAGSGLKSIDLSANTKCTEINSQTFSTCPALETVVLHDGITSIGNNAFEHCTMLKTVEGTLDKLTYLGTDAFNQAKSLTRFDLYDSLKTVGHGAFAVCPALTVYCHFDESKTEETGWDSLWNSYGCPIVWNCDTNEIANDGLVYYVAANGMRYGLSIIRNEDGTVAERRAVVAVQMFALAGNIEIPASVTATVGGEEMTFTVTTIKENAFKDNDKITAVTATSALKNIESNAFANCTSLILFAFTDGNQLERVSGNAFAGSALANPPQAGDTSDKDVEAE